MSAQSAIFNPSQTTSAASGDGFSVPRLTTTGRLAITFTAADKGMMVYDTTLNNLFIWNGAAWESVPASGDAGADGAVQFNDNGVVSGAANFYWSKVQQKVGIGTNSPNVELDVVGNSSITGNLTLSAGTANGVGYLNASKVLTAGSALTFDGTNLGIGGTGQLRFATSGGTIGDNYIGTENSFNMKLHCGRGSTSSIEIASDKLLFYTSASERYRIANDGVATWSNVGGVAGTAMTLNSTGLGVGVAPNRNLDIRQDQSAATIARVQNQSVNAAAYSQVNLSASGNNWGILVGSSAANSNRLEFVVDPSGTNLSVMRLDTSGNVGIGVTPSAWGSTYRALQIGIGTSLTGVTNDVDVNLVNNARFDGTNWKYTNTSPAERYRTAVGTHFWFNAPSGTAGNNITWTQAMTLDASGRLLVGQTSTGLLNINGIDIEGGDSNGGSYIIVNHKLATASGQQYAFFGYNAVKTGDITQNGTTGVLYNTVSDYRLKESIQPLSNGLSRVSALKPSIYKWKSDGSSGEGFLAHELAEVVPFAVTGEKDALNEDGSIKAQSVDMSRVIPILVAAIQELAARVQTLETR